VERPHAALVLTGSRGRAAGRARCLPGVDLVLSTEGERPEDVARRVRDALAAHGMLGA
jgi:hypothetical protein